MKSVAQFQRFKPPKLLPLLWSAQWYNFSLQWIHMESNTCCQRWLDWTTVKDVCMLSRYWTTKFNVVAILETVVGFTLNILKKQKIHRGILQIKVLSIRATFSSMVTCKLPTNTILDHNCTWSDHWLIPWALYTSADCIRKIVQIHALGHHSGTIFNRKCKQNQTGH